MKSIILRNVMLLALLATLSFDTSTGTKHRRGNSRGNKHQSYRTNQDKQVRFDVSSLKRSNQQNQYGFNEDSLVRNTKPTIGVTFTDGTKDILDLENAEKGGSARSIKSCRYLGKLRQDVQSSAAATGCLNKRGDKIEITLISNRAKDQLFSVDFDGKTKVLKNPFAGMKTKSSGPDKIIKGWHASGDALVNKTERQLVALARRTGIPSKLKATIRFGYEESAKKKMGNNVDGWIKDIMTHVTAHYRHPSLGTQIEFETIGQPTFHSGAQWFPDSGNLHQASSTTLSLGMSNTDIVAWLCSSTPNPYVKGIAFIGTCCDQEKKGQHISINEIEDSKAESGVTLAHEIGHTLGMHHDFAAQHGGDGGPCDRKGIMSYAGPMQGFSACSKKDFEQTYANKNWGNGCLEDISGGQPSPTVATTQQPPSGGTNQPPPSGGTKQTTPTVAPTPPTITTKGSSPGGSVQPTKPPTPTGVTTQPNPTGGTIQPTNPNQGTTTPTISISTNVPLPGNCEQKIAKCGTDFSCIEKAIMECVGMSSRRSLDRKNPWTPKKKTYLIVKEN